MIFKRKHNSRERKRKKFTRIADRRMKDHGEIDFNKKIIRVDPDKLTKGGVLDSVMHEELHRKSPKMNEKRIRKQTKKKLKTMSMNDMGDMLKRFKEKPKKKVSHYRTD